MGALTTALFIFYMLAAPLSGWLGDRLNKKQLFLYAEWLCASWLPWPSTAIGCSSSNWARWRSFC